MIMYTKHKNVIKINLQFRTETADLVKKPPLKKLYLTTQIIAEQIDKKISQHKLVDKFEKKPSEYHVQ